MSSARVLWKAMEVESQVHITCYSTGTFTELIQHYLDWNEKSKGGLVLKKICGVLVIAGGVWLVYTAPF